mmetsp:Transcript_14686/g.35469  ORF Transcript_14686/g.35469 Transcript_14686/m.35469 type:complete len:410 (+) Transcript_14686:72-1301(+)
MRWLVALLALRVSLTTTVECHVSNSAKVLAACELEFTANFNISVSEAVRKDVQPPLGKTFERSQLRPGVCEAVFSIIDDNLYVHKNSMSVFNNEDKKVHLRHKEFFESMMRNIQHTKDELGVTTIPNVEFNFQTTDNPTCRYPQPHTPAAPPPDPVAAVVHHSMCAPQLCNGTFLLPVSYNQEMQALELTAERDRQASQIPWARKKNIAFWRGHNKGVPRELAYFEWNDELLPRAKVVQMARKSETKKVLDAHFGAVPWNNFMSHKYVLSLAGNTYGSSFKHQLRSGGCVIRQDERSYEWFEHFVEPWVHYVPVAWNLSDLMEKIAWARENDDRAREIAEAGVQRSRELFSRRKMACYTFVALHTLHDMMGYKLDSPGEDLMPVSKVCEAKRGKRNACVTRRKNSLILE